MQNLMLVTVAMYPGDTSLETREYVHSYLTDDHTFCSEGGRFSDPVCDWFVIGGRWSGLLRETVMGKSYRKKLKQRFPQLAAKPYKEEGVTPHRWDLDDLWREFGGSGPSPFNRDTHEELGDDDDAMPLDRTLYDRLLSKFQGASIEQNGKFNCKFIDLDHEEVDETFIGRKWVVVVDYHN